MIPEYLQILCRSLLIFTCVVSGCSKANNVNDKDAIQDFARIYLSYAAERDYSELRKLVHPMSLSHYVDVGRVKSIQAYLDSIVAAVPASLSRLEIIRIDTLNGREIEGSYGDYIYYELIPDRPSDAIEIKIYYKSDDRDLSLALFLSIDNGAYRILVPDITELWGL